MKRPAMNWQELATLAGRVALAAALCLSSGCAHNPRAWKSCCRFGPLPEGTFDKPFVGELRREECFSVGIEYRVPVPGWITATVETLSPALYEVSAFDVGENERLAEMVGQPGKRLVVHVYVREHDQPHAIILDVSQDRERASELVFRLKASFVPDVQGGAGNDDL